MLDFENLYDFILKTHKEEEAKNIVESIENALDLIDLCKRRIQPLRERYIEAERRLNEIVV